MKNMLEIYRNYLFALQEREEHGDKYGDTEELIKMYEKKLNLTRRTNVQSTNVCRQVK